MVSIESRDLFTPLALVAAGAALFVYTLGRQVQPRERPTLLGDLRRYVGQPIVRHFEESLLVLSPVLSDWQCAALEEVARTSPSYISPDPTAELIELWKSGGLKYD